MDLFVQLYFFLKFPVFSDVNFNIVTKEIFPARSVVLELY